MDIFKLNKEKLKDFLESLHDYTLWAPVKKDNITIFEIITSLKDSVLDLESQVRISKKPILPQTEPLLIFDRRDSLRDLSLEPVEKSVIFGIRPCDARSFLLLDPVFEGTPSDPYYCKKREKTTLIGLACKEPFKNCFCPSMKGDPFSEEGLDILFAELEKIYLVKVITEKGRKIIDKISFPLNYASDEEIMDKEQLAKESLKKISRKINLEGIPEILSEIFEHPIWKEMAVKCIECGICTYTCPTCYCFDIQDEQSLKEGRRVKIWDSCMYEEYTLHASGHNPRPTRAERLRNRIYHKFKYNFESLGSFSCVGCGRCITYCPVNVDLIENLLIIKNLRT